MRKNRSGFTLLEMMTAVIVISVMGATFVKMSSVLPKSREKTCLVSRTSVEQAAERYKFDHESLFPASFETLVSASYIDREPTCPSGGHLVWASTEPAVLLCSIHSSSAPVAQPLTPLGSTFSEISSGLIQLEADFYATHGYWSRSWKPYSFTDLGLNSADWNSPIDHIYYLAGGPKVSVRPEEGWEMTVTNITTGKTMTLTNSLNWYLIYDMTSSSWYYHTIATGHLVDISTLKLLKQ